MKLFNNINRFKYYKALILDKLVISQGEKPDLGIIFEPAILYPMIGLAILSLIPVIYNRIKSLHQNNT